MSNRMSVLSRRLRSFAIFFSFATLASFIVGTVLTSGVGVIFSSNAARYEAVFFFAALVSVCFFAAFFLWLARGFAWAMVSKEPVEEKEAAVEKKVVAEKKLVPENRSVPERTLVVAAEELVAEHEPAATEEPVHEQKFVSEHEPVLDINLKVGKKLVWESTPVQEEKKLVWEDKPEEEKPGSEEGAVYTITGRRIK